MRTSLRMIMVIGAYWLTGLGGNGLSASDPGSSLFWLPPGVALAAYLRWGLTVLPAIAAGAVLLELTLKAPLTTAALTGGGVALSIYSIGLLLSLWGFHKDFARARDCLLLLAAATIGTLISTGARVTGDLLSTDAPLLPPDLYLRWTGETLGILLATPFLLSLRQATPQILRNYGISAVLWLLTAVLVGLLVYPFNHFGPADVSLPLSFLPFPVAIWGAVRFGLLGASSSALWFSGIAIWSASQGVGPFSHLSLETTDALLIASSVTLTVFSLFTTSVHGELQRNATDLSESANRYRQMFEANPHPMWVYDIDSLQFLAVNDSAIRHYGYSRDEFLDLTIKDIRSAEEVPALLNMLADGEGLSATNRFWRHRIKSGEIRLVEASSHALMFDGHKARVVLVTDVTERMHGENRLRHNEMLLKEAQHIAQLGSWELQLGNGQFDLSEEFLQICQQTGASFMRFPEDFLARLHPEDRPIMAAFFQAAQSGSSFDQECRLALSDGQFLWINVRGTGHDARAGAPTRLVGTIQDISVRKATESQIHRLAFFDSLTQLPNRRLLIDRLIQTQASSSRTQHFGSLLFIDLDHFKTLNDTRGHDVGDELLIQVARRIQSCIRESDTAARLGGDEFVVMLTKLGCDRLAAIRHTDTVAEKIREDIGQIYRLNDGEFHTTPSIGIRLFRGHEQSIEDLLKHADVAMYEAKSAGRNTIRFYDPEMQMALERRLALDAQLRRAVPGNELVSYYQAQTDRHGRIFGAELLLRWNHPHRGLILPDQFIPRAEESGLIVTIGNRVLEAACQQLANWKDNPLSEHLVLAVNVSARQFYQPDFVDRLNGMLRDSHAPPNRLKLELTESMLLDNVEDTVRKMQALSQLGVSFSMDDFGTGHSSLTYIKRLPLGQIKIDRSFVRDITHDPNDAVIVRTIIAMARALGLHVIAEGVETRSQLSFLRAQGCEAFQGYLLGKPMPVDEFENSFRKPAEII
ncbi:MAG: EAL domain-containing protein [Hahellaceae bacterium]|nr:EAL domain-containing protein [Hahellaceae bacterium]